MKSEFRLTLAQLNPVTGATSGNADRAINLIGSMEPGESDFVAFPELFVSGYPVQDLVLKPAFVADCMMQVERVARICVDGKMAGIGSPWQEDGKVYNAYHILSDGKVGTSILKHHLPNSGVFDEVRQFSRGPLCGPFMAGPLKMGTPICEDAWHEDVCEMHAECGAEILVVPNGSPYFRNRLEQRQNVMVARVVETGLPLVYLNMVGGQDDQVFDGCSFVLNQGGELAVQLPAFTEAVATVTFETDGSKWRARGEKLGTVPVECEMDYQAMVVGTRDYARKSGFGRAILGLSGGVDSALVATIASDALGAENVRCVLLPSRYTSPASVSDAKDLIARLGCRSAIIGIDELHSRTLEVLEPHFGNRPPDITEENLQSRLRGLLLMAMSNKFGELLLTTGNKSEAAVGYATIYGDMAGGYNPIKDLYKTRVFEASRWRNTNLRDWMKGPAGSPVPEAIIAKPPSAELRDNQRDTDSLPPYDDLDVILEALIDHDLSVEAVVAMGYGSEMVRKVEQLIYRSEYKRFQSAPGVRLTDRALWLDRRYPLVNQWRDKAIITNDNGSV